MRVSLDYENGWHVKIEVEGDTLEEINALLKRAKKGTPLEEKKHV